MGEQRPRLSPGKYAAIATSNLALLVALTIGLELAFGNWFEAFVPPQMAIVNRSYKYRQELYYPSGDVLYMRDKYGLRGSHEAVSEIELATVGGSTTDQRYITEGQTWQDVLRTLTGVRVANAGVDGMTSFGHLVAVSEWLHEIPNFSPKSYLHYIGVNDVALSQESRQHDFDRSGKLNSWLSLSKRSAIVGAVEKLWFQSTGPRAVAHGVITPRPNATFVKVDIDQDTIEPFIESVYKPNLRKLIELHRLRNERAIFVSQIAHPSLIQWKNGETFVAADSGNLRGFAVALNMINIATERTCRESADLCRFYDLATRVRFEARDFYDLVHTTPSGAQKIGAFLGEEACSHAPARDDVPQTLPHCQP